MSNDLAYGEVVFSVRGVFIFYFVFFLRGGFCFVLLIFFDSPEDLGIKD